jgi:hypothetical protein
VAALAPAGITDPGYNLASRSQRTAPLDDQATLRASFRTKNNVIFSRYPNIFNAVRQSITSLLVVMLAAASPSLSFASGSSAGIVPASARQLSATRANATNAQTLATNSSQPEVAEEPYNLGKALYSGKYRFGTPKLTDANVAEKMLRLVSLQRALPAPERKKINARELSQRLTNREMNALEYYLRIRFEKFITKPPSWAKSEPPPKVASAE